MNRLVFRSGYVRHLSIRLVVPSVFVPWSAECLSAVAKALNQYSLGSVLIGGDLVLMRCAVMHSELRREMSGSSTDRLFYIVTAFRRWLKETADRWQFTRICSRVGTGGI
jgi:hypothetical protein